MFKGDGNFHFILSKGPDANTRVAGDIVIEAEYDNQGLPQSFRAAVWSDPGPTLGAFVAVGTDNSNVEASSLGYFAEVAIDLTALGLAPNADELAPDSCVAFGFGRVVSRTGNSDNSTSGTMGNRRDWTSTSAAGWSYRRRSQQQSRAIGSSRFPSRPRRGSHWTTPIRCSWCRRGTR